MEDLENVHDIDIAGRLRGNLEQKARLLIPDTDNQDDKTNTLDGKLRALETQFTENEIKDIKRFKPLANRLVHRIKHITDSSEREFLIKRYNTINNALNRLLSEKKISIPDSEYLEVQRFEDYFITPPNIKSDYIPPKRAEYKTDSYQPNPSYSKSKKSTSEQLVGYIIGGIICIVFIVYIAIPVLEMTSAVLLLILGIWLNKGKILVFGLSLSALIFISFRHNSEWYSYWLSNHSSDFVTYFPTFYISSVVAGLSSTYLLVRNLSIKEFEMDFRPFSNPSIYTATLLVIIGILLLYFNPQSTPPVKETYQTSLVPEQINVAPATSTNSKENEASPMQVTEVVDSITTEAEPIPEELLPEEQPDISRIKYDLAGRDLGNRNFYDTFGMKELIIIDTIRNIWEIKYQVQLNLQRPSEFNNSIAIVAFSYEYVRKKWVFQNLNPISFTQN